MDDALLGTSLRPFCDEVFLETRRRQQGWGRSGMDKKSPRKNNKVCGENNEDKKNTKIIIRTSHMSHMSHMSHISYYFKSTYLSHTKTCLNIWPKLEYVILSFGKFTPFKFVIGVFQNVIEMQKSLFRFVTVR